MLPQAAKADAVIKTDATRVFDNVTGQLATLDQGAPTTPAPPATESPAPAEPARQRIDLSVPELDLHLLDHHLNGTSLQSPPRPGTLRLSWSEQFRHFVIWTLRERDFVCLEPWTAAGDALNTGHNLIPLAPGESLTTRFDIEWLAK
jgi:galactose mutarotase-like enzyme